MKKYDYIVIIFILCAAAAGFVWVNAAVSGDAAEGVIIEVDGAEYAKYYFNEISEIKTVEVFTKFGYNRVEIGKNYARVTDASCPNKLDVHMGAVTGSGQMIVCLPNRLIVRIFGNDKSIDAVAK